MIKEHCAYAQLEILVTQDDKCCGEAYRRTEEKYRSEQNHTDPRKRDHYKKITEAGAALRNPKQRQAMIQAHQEAFAAFIPFWLQPVLQQEATSIAKETYNLMMTGAMDENGPYHLSEALAKQVIDDVLSRFGISVGGTFKPKPPADPRLIEDFTVVSQKNGLRLSWTLPEQDCDRVIIRRSYDDYPDEKGGEEIFNSKGQEWLDDKVQAGRKVFYSVFSCLGDRISTAKVTLDGFWAEGVKDLKAIEHVGKIELRCTPPKAKYERIVIFRSAPNQHLEIVREGGVLTAKGDHKRFFVNGQDGYLDEEIAPGETYDYCVFVDYGAVGYEQVFSDGQTISGSSIRPANPVKNLQISSQKEGIKLTWENPKNRCDAVKVVRRTDRFPKTDVDGDLLYQGTGAEFIDKEKIEAGVTYDYSIFSVYRGHASEPVSEKKLYAGDVNDLKIQSHVGFVELQWKPPAHYEEILLFRGDQRPPKVSPNGGILKVSDGVQLTLPHRRLSDYDDQGVVPGRQYHYLIVVRYADGQYSSGETVKGTALEPARPVDSLQIQVDSSGHVHLKWESPDPNNKNYKYDVYRQEDSPITSPAKDKCIGTVSTPKYDDEKTHPGKDYYYAVYSRLGTVVADRPAQEKVFVTADVTLKRVVPKDGGVLIEWSPPANVKRIEVLREGQPLRVTSRTHAVDSGLQNERTYRYTIIAVFADKSGAEIRSKGIPCEATPVKPPDILRDLAIHYDGQKVTLTWRLPSSPIDAIFISRLNAPPNAKERDLFNVSEFPDVKRLSGNITSYIDREVRSGDVSYYAFYTVKQNMAVYCGSLEVALLEEVTNLKAFNQGEEVWLTWDWPAHVDYVRVVRTPKGAKPEWIYTRGRYDGNGSMMVDKVDSRPRKYRYQIHTVRNMNGKEVTSLVGTSVEVRGGCLPTITYDLDTPRQSWSPFSPKIVVVTCDVYRVDFPFSGLVLRKKKSERLRDAMDGREVDRWSGNELQKKEVILRDNHPEFDGETYYQVFLVDAKESEIIQIESPSINRLRV